MSGLILIIEDEEDLVSMLEYNLEKGLSDSKRR